MTSEISYCSVEILTILGADIVHRLLPLGQHCRTGRVLTGGDGVEHLGPPPAHLRLVPVAEYLIHVLGNHTLAVHLDRYHLDLQREEGVLRTGVGPLLDEYRVALLHQHEDNLAPSVGRTAVNKHVPVGVSGFVYPLNILAQEQGKGGRASGCLILERRGELDGLGSGVLDVFWDGKGGGVLG